MNRKCQIRFSAVLVLIALIFAGAEALAQTTMYQAKVDNFLFLYDATSSMDEIYRAETTRRSVLAREAMAAVNKDIPPLPLQSGLFKIAPSLSIYQDMSAYDTNRFEFAIAQTPLPARHLGPQTSLEKGLEQLKPVLSRLEGTTALILFSDGGENKGGAPETVMKELYEQFDLCFHFVSYAHTPEEKESVGRMSGLENCSLVISGEDVEDPRLREEFVREIFYRVIRDSDGDGVPDYLDKCPDTPGDLVVDEDGCPIARRMTLDVKFDFDKAVVKPKYHSELKKAADFLQDRPGITIVVEGHTDSIGTREYNLELSRKRAESVKQYLVEEFGISESRISTEAYGESRPVADNKTDAGRQKNRRVEGVFPEVFLKK